MKNTPKIHETLTLDVKENGDIQVVQVRIMPLDFAVFLGFDFPETDKKLYSFCDSKETEEESNTTVKIEALNSSKKLKIKATIYRIFTDSENQKMVRIVSIFQ